MLPGRHDRAIDHGGHRQFQDRLVAVAAVFRVVVGPFQILERRSNVHRAVMVRADPVGPTSRSVQTNLGGSDSAKFTFAEADA